MPETALFQWVAELSQSRYKRPKNLVKVIDPANVNNLCRS